MECINNRLAILKFHPSRTQAHEFREQTMGLLADNATSRERDPLFSPMAQAGAFWAASTFSNGMHQENYNYESWLQQDFSSKNSKTPNLSFKSFTGIV